MGAFAMTRVELDRLVRAKVRLDEAAAEVLGQPQARPIEVMSPEKLRQAAVAAGCPIERATHRGRTYMQIIYKGVLIRHAVPGAPRQTREEGTWS